LKVLELSFGYDSPSFASCFFPHLRKLLLHDELCRCHSFDQESVFKFLERHPTIEQLVYHPVVLETRLGLSPGSLPALRQISSGHRFTMSILRDTTVSRREMEAIGQISLGPNTMQDLENIATSGSKLWALDIWNYDDIRMVYRVAELFPNIRILKMSRFGVPRGEMDESTVCPSFCSSYPVSWSV
jgi:hypothetical protein